MINALADQNGLPLRIFPSTGQVSQRAASRP